MNHRESFQRLFLTIEDTDQGHGPQLAPGHTQEQRVFYDQMALVMSYQHCHSGTSVVDKGASDHTRRVLSREQAGVCSVL